MKSEMWVEAPKILIGENLTTRDFLGSLLCSHILLFSSPVPKCNHVSLHGLEEGFPTLLVP